MNSTPGCGGHGRGFDPRHPTCRDWWHSPVTLLLGDKIIGWRVDCWAWYPHGFTSMAWFLQVGCWEDFRTVDNYTFKSYTIRLLGNYIWQFPVIQASGRQDLGVRVENLGGDNNPTLPKSECAWCIEKSSLTECGERCGKIPEPIKASTSSWWMGIIISPIEWNNVGMG